MLLNSARTSLRRNIRPLNIRPFHRNLSAVSSSDETNDEAPPTTTDAPSSIETKISAKKIRAAANDTEGNLLPAEVVNELDRHIVGQQDAKRAVAIAMRNRWRRKQLPLDLKKEVTPRNVLMIGPTGCGKTEVARRMADIGGFPFIKVEATKFTEVGYHGRDVDSIIRDLMDISMALTRKQKTEKVKLEAELLVEERILDLLSGPETSEGARPRESFRDMLRDGLLDEQEIEVDVPVSGGGNSGGSFQIDPSGNNPDIEKKWGDVLSMFGKKGGPSMVRKKMLIPEAKEVILAIEVERLLDGMDLKKEALDAVEESGIVFFDEIDKICSSREFSSFRSDASADGVQRDLLPLVEGTTINTKYGNVKTDYILFVASGAFHSVKPSDMLPELQGRLPIRVELHGLTENDLYRILTEPVANLVRQQIELLATEGVTLKFEDSAIREIARIVAVLNRTVENIGARRIHTAMERIMEQLSFDCTDMEPGTVLTVDKKLVEERLSDAAVSNDLSRYIL
eukprot:CAMPEP_0194353824 /NCGR_PEP_ID=MMETSP0174-20130528/2052_1 /TAXON_ID=216777 /ORGANISM="Proboscia alata, Strain PI-D3" /LENGTH=511 /DNA_ID=CAMNT_0039122509 /DNA_START=118 /DNA_END=1653 /DNA_ORIENTATION=+